MLMVCSVVGLVSQQMMPIPIVQAQESNFSRQTANISESKVEFITPKLMNQSTGQMIDQDHAHYHPKIYLDATFGQTGKNENIGKDINLYSTNSVFLNNIPDAYRFIRVVVQSDVINGRSYTKEISKVIKIGSSYYGLIKGTTQDYLKFSHPEEQLIMVYNRYLMIGFKESVGASHFNYLDNDNQGVLSGLTPITPGGITEEQFQKGYYIKGQQEYLDKRLYFIPDFQAIRFSRVGISEISAKIGTAENTSALRSSVNFYEFGSLKSNQKFKENINSYGYLSQNGTITYDYFVKNSGIVSLDTGIPNDEGSEEIYTLHFPNDVSALRKSTVFTSQYDAQNGKANGMAEITWAYVTGRDVYPFKNNSNNLFDGVNKTNDYPISRGGTVVFTLQDTNDGSHTFFTHLNKLVINGQSINIPIAQLRAKAKDKITQQYSQTAYTYLKTGELVAVNYVPVGDNYTGTGLTPWLDAGNRKPYYFVTIMNIQGDILINAPGEKRPDGSITNGADISFIQDGHGLDYGWQHWSLSIDKGGLSVGKRDVSTLLAIDEDLDTAQSVIFSGYESGMYQQFDLRDLPQGYYIDGEKTNGLGIVKSRRLIVDNSHPLSYQLLRSSKDNKVGINDESNSYLGRYYNQVSQTGVSKDEFAQNGHYWIDINSNTSEWDYASTLYKLDLTNKYFKTFSVQYQNVSGQVETSKTVNNLVFPKSNVSLTSSFDIDDFGHVKSLEGNGEIIGTTGDKTNKVTKQDELGFITIPALPDGASYYELSSVQTNNHSISLIPQQVNKSKRYLPGQKVFVGEFLPMGTDFGFANGIDNGSVVTLRAVKVTPFIESRESSYAQQAKEKMQVYTTVDKWEQDKLGVSDFVLAVGATDFNADFEVTDSNAADLSTDSPVPQVEAYVLKNFHDGSYEILPTSLTVKKIPQADLKVYPQQIIDPLTHNKEGVFPFSLRLAESSTTEDVSVTLTDEMKNNSIVSENDRGNITSIRVPLELWLANDKDEDTLPVNYIALAKGSVPINRKARSVLNVERNVSASSLALTNLTTTTTPTTNRTENVVLTLEKANSPTPKVTASANKAEIIISFAKQSAEDFSLAADTGGLVQISNAANDIKVTKQLISNNENQVDVHLSLDRPLIEKETLQVTYRYNVRYKRSTTEVTVTTNVSDIINTGLYLAMPELSLLLLGLCGIGGYFYFWLHRMRTLKTKK